MSWFKWKLGRLIYAPLQDGDQIGFGMIWKPIGFGLYWGRRESFEEWMRRVHPNSPGVRDYAP